MRRGDLLRLAWVHPHSRALLFAATLAAFRATPATARLVIAGLSGLLLAIGLSVDPLAFGLLVALIVWSLPILFAKTAALRLLARRLRPCRIGSACTLGVEVDGLRWSCDGVRRVIPWRELRELIESRPLLLVRHAGGDLILPARAFADGGHRDDLRTLLAVRSGLSPRWVLLPGSSAGPR